jgi:RNA polymerase sigma-70 factor (ECF subfamily)
VAKSKVSVAQKEFESIALVHTDALLRTALRMTRNQNDAEDLVQETMLKAYRFFDRFERGSNIKAWLFKIMTNIFINNYRQKARKPTGVSYEDIDDNFLYHQLENSRGITADPEEMLFSKLMDSDVRSAIGDLPEDFRMVVVLAFLEGFSYEEIAEIADIQLGTVKSRLHRARKLLQKSLWDYAVQRGIATEGGK